ncbi:hypothetical protein BCL90_3377 [Pedobacter alluvionis]|uniref:Uncharacterized protein n=1 Tax=Pedobacter alluvionis TaxID=475253 RepID=A0A497XY33_9SPHI|nr:hypothetical protein BCL90_3377 [Pedobacter alluvionis]
MILYFLYSKTGERLSGQRERCFIAFKMTKAIYYTPDFILTTLDLSKNIYQVLTHK